MTLYGIKTCGSVKKAMAYLSALGLPYTFHDFKTDPVDQAKIAAWLTKSDISILLNTKGTKYKTLGLAAMRLSEEDKIGWMTRENLLIKRPVIERDDGSVLIGFDETRYAAVFANH